MGRKFGVSFSAKRALGISVRKPIFLMRLACRLLKSGRERKLARMLTGGKCFVASACYRDVDHADVATLRRFRDEVLIRSRPGRCFIELYAVIGPILANAIDARPWLRPICRTAVSSIVRYVQRCGFVK